MKKEISVALRLSALSIALLAAGCGGGGGGGDSSDTTAAATRSVSGTAAKGIIKNGVVKVFALDAQGNKGSSPVATGTTGADGTFTVSIPRDVLLFVVEVSAGANTVMADEATGKDIAMPASMTLRNIVTLTESVESYTGAVSPLTEMAVKAAESAAGGLTTANIKAAKAEMIGRFGFDPEAVKPVNMNSGEASTASDEQKKQALILAGISRMAREGAPDLGCAAADIDCVVKKVASAASPDSIKTIVTKLEEAANAAANDPSIENKTGTTIVLVPNKPGAPPADEAPVVSAKKLFASLRTNLNAIAASETVLEARAEQVATDFDGVIAPVDEELANWVAVSTAAIEHLNAYKAAQAPSNSFNMPGVGGCTVYTDDTLKTEASTPANAGAIGCALNRRTIAWVFTGTTLTETKVAHAITITPDAGNVYNYVSRARRETWVNGSRNPSNDVVLGNYGTLPRAAGKITYAATPTGTFAIKGMMPARLDDAGNAITDHELVDLNASIGYDGTANVTTYSLAASITSVKGGAEKGRIVVNPGSALRVNGVPGTIATSLIKDFVLSISGVSGASTVTGTLSLTDWKGDKTKALYAPAVASFAGSLTRNDQQYFSGELKYTTTGFDQYDSTQSASETNFLAQTLRLSGKLAIPNRPALDMFLAATPLKTGGFDLSAQYDDGGVLINFSGKRAADGSLSSATISSSTGVSVSVTQADLDAKSSVNVKKNGETVATIKLDTGVVYYTDGSFESLK